MMNRKFCTITSLAIYQMVGIILNRMLLFFFYWYSESNIYGFNVH